MGALSSRLGVVHLTVASPRVPVHVTVSARSSWISVALSTAALVLAVVSIGWQAYTFRRSGSRVLVHARFAMGPEGFDATGRPPAFRFPADKVMAGMPPGQLRRLPMVAVIQNVGLSRPGSLLSRPDRQHADGLITSACAAPR